MDPIVAVLAEQFKFVHQTLRAEVAGLTPEQLDYVAAPATNSLDVLVTHIVGSESEVWMMVAGKQTDRDRAAEFETRGTVASTLLERIDAADKLIDELAPFIDAASLGKTFERLYGPNPKRSGAAWLIGNLAHAREHVGHLQLTKQLFPDHYPPLAHPW